MSTRPPIYPTTCPHVSLRAYREVAYWTKNGTCQKLPTSAAPASEAM